MRKQLTIAVTAALIAIAAGQAWAQSCTPNANNRCLVRFGTDPNKYISRLYPGVGGQVVCDSLQPNKVQYDLYTWQSAYIYACSMDQDCSWAQTNDVQAYNQFCP